MTCGMLCVMRREKRGVLHLDKYSPPKAICSVDKRREKGKKKRGEEKRKRKRKERRKTMEMKENQHFSD